MGDFKAEVKMTMDMAQAMNDLLVGLTPKKRTELRRHSHLTSALFDGCTTKKRVKQGDSEQIQKSYNVDGGTLAITREDAMEYLVDSLNDKLESGVHGSLSIGYSALDEALTAYNPELKEKE